MFPGIQAWARSIAKTFPVSALLGLFLSAAAQAGVVETLPRVKPSIAGVGTVHPLRNPRIRLLGTGFVVADGRHVITNAHVAPAMVESEKGETVAVFLRGPEGVIQRRAEKLLNDPDHDLILLKLDGDPLPALKLARADEAREGEMYYFTGYPIGAVLGLYPATHRAGLAAIAPTYAPQASGRTLNPKLIRRAQDPFLMYQLDATAYPGNSGSPLYDGNTGEVVGVINSVFVKEGKESALHSPSGISYAIPGRYVRALLEKAGLKP